MANATRVIGNGQSITVVTQVEGQPLSGNVVTSLSLASNGNLSNLNPKQQKDLESTIQTGVTNAPASTFDADGRTKEQNQDILVNNITNQWITNQKNAPDTVNVSNINTSTLLGIAPPANNAIDTLRGQGISQPYNPNVSFDQNNNQEVIRQSALAQRSRNLNPKTKGLGNNPNGGTLVDTITGADLSVFFLTEVPDINDVMNSDIPKHLWRKEIMLIEIDSVLSASYSIMREVFPVRTVGTTKPKSFVRGPVTISGHLAFTIFTEDVLVRLRTQMQTSINDMYAKATNVINNYNKSFNTINAAAVNTINTNTDININNSESINNMSGKLELLKSQAESLQLQIDAEFDYSVKDILSKKLKIINADILKINTDINAIADNQKSTNQETLNANNNRLDYFNNSAVENLKNTYQMYNKVLNTGGIFMLNQLLPFHILIMGTTERGIFSKMMIKNIRVIDENQLQGVQQPNIVNRISFVAEDIFPLMSGNIADDMSYSATANVDQNSISADKYAIYTGSQVMKDISGMTAGNYSLGGK